MSIEIDKDAIIALCQKHHIRTLSLFGSVIRDDFHDESDVDILVEFEPNCTPGFEFIDIQDQLSKIVGRTVDLNTPKSLSRHFRDQTVATAINIYVKP
ncbi:MAG: nucleotidyltransferase family protein [Cyanobacteria bacterium J06581_3]